MFRRLDIIKRLGYLFTPIQKNGAFFVFMLALGWLCGIPLPHTFLYLYAAAIVLTLLPAPWRTILKTLLYLAAYGAALLALYTRGDMHPLELGGLLLLIHIVWAMLHRSMKRSRLILPRVNPGVSSFFMALLGACVLCLIAVAGLQIPVGQPQAERLYRDVAHVVDNPVQLSDLRQRLLHIQLDEPATADTLQQQQTAVQAEEPQPAREPVVEEAEEAPAVPQQPAIVDSCSFRVPTIILIATKAKACPTPDADRMGLVRFTDVSTSWQEPSDTTLLVRLFRQAGYEVQLASSLSTLKAPDSGHHFIVVTPDKADGALTTALAAQIAPLNAMLVGASDNSLWLWGSQRYRDSHPYGWSVINDSRRHSISSPDALFHFLLYLGGITTPSYQHDRNPISYGN